MKPARFSYEVPETVEEAVSLLGEHGYEAKLLAGGQSLIPLLSFRMARPAVLVDVNRVQGLDFVEWESDGVRIGALARHRVLETDPELTTRCPMAAEALALVGHVAIRNRGTVAGSMAHADPAAEWPLVALVLGGVFTVVGPVGERQVPASEFFRGFMTTVLEPDEMITELRLDMPRNGSGSAFLEFARRHGDYAQAGAGSIVQLDGSGRVSDARVGLLGVGTTPIRASAVEEALVGVTPTETDLVELSQLAGESMAPLDDVHADADYKRHLGTVMVRRTLETALQRAREVAV
ncbi:MAG: xanthine dehydrogenase family protein subunit M [Acidimicrobiia bacterium]|nr:xanthine dehydrogenase family protein subunit M [Acidimicrobiia bacterium]